MESSGRAYGAGKAGEPFHPVEFVKRPRTILRILSWVFAIIVFGCIVSEGYRNGTCIYNADNNACHYGVAIGIIAFIGATAFFVSDLVFPSITSAEKRKKIVIADMAFSGLDISITITPSSGIMLVAAVATIRCDLVSFSYLYTRLWTFMYFVGFCYLTNAWSKVEDHSFGQGNAQAAIAFSFFSIISWGGLTYLSVKDYREGTLSAFAPTYTDPTLDQSSSPYSSFPGGESGMQSSYQDPPFSQKEGLPEYQPPTY